MSTFVTRSDEQSATTAWHRWQLCSCPVVTFRNTALVDIFR